MKNISLCLSVAAFISVWFTPATVGVGASVIAIILAHNAKESKLVYGGGYGQNKALGEQVCAYLALGWSMLALLGQALVTNPPI
jgi:hypothetical protein